MSKKELSNVVPASLFTGGCYSEGDQKNSNFITNFVRKITIYYKPDYKQQTMDLKDSEKVVL